IPDRSLVRLERVTGCDIFAADFAAIAGWEETMFSIPEWAVGVGAICVVCFLTIPLAARLFPKGMRPVGTGSKMRLADEAQRVEELERRGGQLEAGQRGGGGARGRVGVCVRGPGPPGGPPPAAPRPGPATPAVATRAHQGP